MYEHPLDNPIWNGLTGPHARLGVGAGKVRRSLAVATYEKLGLSAAG